MAPVGNAPLILKGLQVKEAGENTVGLTQSVDSGSVHIPAKRKPNNKILKIDDLILKDDLLRIYNIKAGGVWHHYE